MKNRLTLIFALIVSTVFAQSVVIPADNTFYNPDIKSYRKTISATNKASDQSGLIQSAIDEVAKKGGGILFFSLAYAGAITLRVYSVTNLT